MQRSRQLVYPPPLVGPLPLAAVTADLAKVQDFRTFTPQARRIPLRFNRPTSLLVKVSSDVGARKGWMRAGVFAQVLAGLPGNPKKDVTRLYLDEGFFEFDGGGYDFYVEFWPQVWLSDYRLEVWAQLTPQATFIFNGSTLSINGGDSFTIDGLALVI